MPATLHVALAQLRPRKGDYAANLYRDDDVDWEETTAARVALRWQPGDV